MNKWLRHSGFLLIFAVLLVFATACGEGEDTSTGSATSTGSSDAGSTDMESDANPEGYLSIQGSDTMVNLGQAWAEYYMENVNPNAQLAVTGGGSGTGIAAMINNDVNIAQSSRAMKEEEIEDAIANGAEPVEWVVAQDGLAVYVHADNPLADMTFEDLKAVFTGEFNDWSEVGWADGGPINRFSRQSNSGTYVFFNETVMDGEDWGPNTNFMPGSAAVVEGVSQDKGGIGYSGVGYNEPTVNALNIAPPGGGDFVTPLDSDMVDSGEYPIARPLFFYSNGVPGELMLHYLLWVLQDADSHQVVYDIGFYQVGPYEEVNDKAFEAVRIEQ